MYEFGHWLLCMQFVMSVGAMRAVVQAGCFAHMQVCFAETMVCGHVAPTKDQHHEDHVELGCGLSW